jgi:ABC-type phosphate transport system ATPase subunit
MNKIKKIYIKKYRQFEDFVMNFNDDEDNIYSIISKNGLGKSNLLQFIFVMINSIKNEKFHILLKNLLEKEIVTNYSKKEKVLFSEFEINKVNIKFYIVPIIWEGINFEKYDEVKELEKYLCKLKKIENNVDKLHSLIKKMIEGTPEIILRRNLREIYYEFDDYNFDYEKAVSFLKQKDISGLKSFIENYINSFNEQLENKYLVEEHLNNIKLKIENYENILKEKNLKKICKINNEYFLLAKIEEEENIPDIYLVAPNYQPFHFLTINEKHQLLENFEEYISILEILREELNNKVYFYNFLNEDEVSEIENHLMKIDKEYLDKTGEYGTLLPTFKKDLAKLLENKKLSIKNDNNIEIIYDNKKLNLTDLSHGELKRISLYIWCKYYPVENSIILFDELELAFHPTWQIKIVEDLRKWLKDKQVIIATHSPQILNNINYKNIILLDKNKKIEAINFNAPPINRDINSILKEIMGSDFIPKKVLELRDKFEKAYIDGNEEEIKKIKAELLKWEGDEYIRRVEYLYMLGNKK